MKQHVNLKWFRRIMNKLIINTANDDLLMVLKTKDQVFFKTSDSKMRHNESMLPLLDELLADSKLKIEDVNEFGVVIGPGSFTGIRVGISTIKALRDALNVKAKGINNLDFLYSLAFGQNKDIETVAILGSRDSYFVAKKIGDVLYKYEHNLTLAELNRVADNKPVGMFKADENVNSFVVNVEPNALVECFEKSKDETLVPVYYQLSQAENEKLKNGVVEIVEASEKDIDKVLKIETESMQTNALTKQDFERALNNENYKLFICKFNGEVVGFVLLQITDELCVMGVAVEKEMRNVGVATRLFNKAFEFAKSINLQTVSLEVSEKNLTASLLYQKLGFASRRIRKNYYSDGSNAIEMFKSLN